jgi:hypothetical protein
MKDMSKKVKKKHEKDKKQLVFIPYNLSFPSKITFQLTKVLISHMGLRSDVIFNSYIPN